jgi:RimJ/RimL family protein N-acetyltransferase
MQLAEFMAAHVPALERQEVRHNLILGVLARAASTATPIMLWSLGEPGACAIKWPGRSIILGEVTREQCEALSDLTRELDYPGVVGLDRAPAWFAAHGAEHGITFAEPIPQSIQELRTGPPFPAVAGEPRQAAAGDAELLAGWLQAFEREAVPYDPPTPRAALEKAAAEGRHTFWTVDGEPVSVAGVARRLRNVAAIAPVYTPPALRGRGYGGAATAAVCVRLLADGKAAVCLYTDMRNAAANRCYAKLGFSTVCESHVYLRR